MPGRFVLQDHLIDFIIGKWLGVDEQGLRPFSHFTLTDFLERYCRLPSGYPGVHYVEGTSKRDRLQAALSEPEPDNQVEILSQLLKWDRHPPGRDRDRNLDPRVQGILERLKSANSNQANTVDAATLPEFAQRALDEAERLASSNRYQMAVDRIHVAIHDCGKALLVDQGVTPPKGFQETFGMLRKHHPAFRVESGDGPSADVLRGLGRVLDGLNTMRNNNSMSHPTQALLADPEARLAYNAGVASLQYTLDRVKEHTDDGT